VREAVERAVAAAPADIAVSGEVVTGAPAPVLMTESRSAALVVVGDRGLGGFTGLLVGSVAVQLTAHAHHAAARVVVGVDGSAASLTALRFAAEAAVLRRGVLHVVHAWHMPSWNYAALMWSLPDQGVEELETQARTTLKESLLQGLGDAADLEVEQSLVEAPTGHVGRRRRGSRPASRWFPWARRLEGPSAGICVHALHHALALSGGGGPRCVGCWRQTPTLTADHDGL
jgi:nucleotide-binding universal stress UspA family protein